MLYDIALFSWNKVIILLCSVSQRGFNCDGNKLPVWANEWDLYRFLPFCCQLRSCPRLSSFSMYGQVLLKPGGILFTEFTHSKISVLVFLKNKSNMTVKQVLSQQWRLFACSFTPINTEVPEESPDALRTCYWQIDLFSRLYSKRQKVRR